MSIFGLFRKTSTCQCSDFKINFVKSNFPFFCVSAGQIHVNEIVSTHVFPKEEQAKVIHMHVKATQVGTMGSIATSRNYAHQKTGEEGLALASMAGSSRA